MLSDHIINLIIKGTCIIYHIHSLYNYRFSSICIYDLYFVHYDCNIYVVYISIKYNMYYIQ